MSINRRTFLKAVGLGLGAAGFGIPALAYDRCVVSPGIDFKWETVAGYDAGVAERVPHAWKAGSQTVTLRAQLEAMDDGGTVIVAPPENPFRCPPGPYERISQIAYYLKQHKPASKVLVLDAKPSFSKQPAFELGWETLYGYGPGGMIEWLPADRVVQLDEASRTVTTANGFSYQGDVINIIPNQKANSIAFAAGLTDGDWCPVNLRTFESTLDPGIHVIGDACIGSALPKSGFAANAEAKACAAAVAALLDDQTTPTPAFTNTCYSVVGEDYGISIIAMYKLSEDGRAISKIPGAGGLTPLDASPDDLRREVGYAHSWYNNFVKDVFG
jgi:sulfide dehydrogenase [flavocytochrome c] flavoprotein subunit